MAERLTSTQRIILTAAATSSTGSVTFGAGDRKGTRVAGHDKLGRPVIKAYQTPEYFLVKRGLLSVTNERHCYCITDAGREAIGI